MDASLNINDILSKVKKLDSEAQITLLERLVRLVTKSKTNQATTTNLTKLSGLGSEIWKDTNIEQYIEEERQW